MIAPLPLMLMLADPLDPADPDYVHDCTAETVQPFEFRLAPRDIATAEISPHPQNGEPTLNLRFSAAGNERFVDFQQDHVGQVIVLCFGDRLLARPRLMEPIYGGMVQVTGGWTTEEAQTLIEHMKAEEPPSELR